MSNRTFRLLLVVCALLTSNSLYSRSFPSGRYEVVGYLHLKDNPGLVVANQTFVFNGDTIITDSNGKYTYSVFWVMVPGLFTSKAHYSAEYPKHINVICAGKKLVFLNKAKEYGYLSEQEGKMTIVMYNLPVSLESIDEGAKIVEYRF